MHSWFVWLVFAIVCILFGFVGYHFAVRTLRIAMAVFALAVVVAVTRYGVAHQGAGTHADLVNSFTQGFDDLSHAFFQPPLGHNNPIPGRLGWLVIIGLLVLAYRELEVWAMRWQPPTVDMSALGGDQPATRDSSAPGEQDNTTTDQQRHARVANELRFRLPAVAVKAPAVLPGGTKVSGLVSIAESTGSTTGGLAGAIIHFVGSLWPSPRQYQIRLRVEPPSSGNQDAGSARVTVDLAESRTGGSITTKTLAARQLDEAASVVAGYVARQIFSADPTAPAWCYGSSDGSDLAAMLMAWQERVPPKTPDDIHSARETQIENLERAVSRMLCAGIPRYELAQLYDIEDRHLEALRLHTINREQYPRFYRGRYRLGMSLEMIANPKFILPNDGNKANKAKEDLCESLRILDGCRITHDAARFRHCITLGKPLPHKLRKELLNAAQKELRTVRRQLTLRRITWAAIVHRDERAIWKRYWRLTERQRFQDSVRVAELLVTVRQSLKENGRDGHTELSTGHGPPVDRADMCPCAEQEQQQEGHPGKVTNNVRIQSFLKVLLARYRRRKAMNITAAIAGDRSAIIRRYRSAIDAALRSEEWQPPKKMEKMQPGPRARRTRWVPWQQRTPSWQAAYNTACLYAALAGKYDKDKIRKDKLTELVVASLERAISDRHNEMGRPSDWIAKDPDFSSVRSSKIFEDFCTAQWQRDYPEINSASFDP